MYIVENNDSMKTRLSGLLIVLWLLIGITMVGLVYYSCRRPAINDHNNAIIKLVEMSSNVKRLLPKLFQIEPALLASFIIDPKGNLIGSMFEPNRLSKDSYSKWVTTIRGGQEIYLQDSYSLHRLSASANQVILVSQNSVSILQMWSQLKADVLNLRYFALGYFVPALGLIGFFIFSIIQKDRVHLRMAQMKPKVEKQSNDSAKKFGSNVADEVLRSHGGTSTSQFLYKNQLMQIMQDFSGRYSIERQTFYLRENNMWMPFLQQRGAITLKGSTIKEIPDILQVTDNYFNEFITTPDKKSAVIFVLIKNAPLGAFYFEFSEVASEQQLTEMSEKASELGHTIFVQKIYEKATIDEQTKAYTYPYFYFLLKEKIVAETCFATVIFSMQGIESITASTVRKWVAKVKHNLSSMRISEDELPLCRLHGNRFAILLSEGNIEQGTEVMKLIKDTAKKLFFGKVQAIGTLVSRTNGVSNVDDYINRLEYALQISLETRSFGAVMNETAVGIA